MSPNSITHEATMKQGPLTLARFDVRAHLTELMDGPCTYDELRACLRNLAQVNQFTRAYAPTIQWLRQMARKNDKRPPLHVVDVGCGGGDMLRRIERWSAHEGIEIRLTGVDLNPHAIRAAREFSPVASRIRWVVGEADSLNAKDGAIDVVISSLFTHHLNDEQILEFLRWMEQTARRGWFVNDLYRTRSAYIAFKALAAAVRWHRFIRNDGPISIRRAFSPADWRDYICNAGLSQQQIRIDVRWPARICVSRVKQP